MTDKLRKESIMNKEQIIIDGEKYNKCNGCKLWDGYICTGDRSYEPNAEAHRAICNEHMAKEFWKVYHELFYKTQECEQIKEKYEALKLENQEGYEIVAELKHECEELKDARFNLNCEIYSLNRYRKALEEIEEVCLEDTRTFADGTQVRYDSLDEILDIINKAKGDNNENT